MTRHHQTFKTTLFGNAKLITLFIVTLLSAQIASAQTNAKAILIKNHVTVETQDKAPIDITRGANIQVGDIIRTGTQSRAIIRFHDGSILTLGSNTIMKVEVFTATEESKKGQFNFVKGAFRMVTGAITDTDSPDFTVNTPLGSIGVRGTDFWGGNLTDDQTIDVVLLESKHVIEITNQHGKVILKEPKQGTTLVANKAPLSPRVWPAEKLQRAFKTVATD